jgi:hypothetical protein
VALEFLQSSALTRIPTGSIPSMMNLSGMIVESRGRTESDAGKSDEELIQARLEELKVAETLYQRAAAHGSVLAQQQQQQVKKEDEAAGPTEASVGEEIAQFAQEALVKVQEMVQAIMKERQRRLEAAKGS